MYRLQRAGWEISQENDLRMYSHRYTIHHRETGMVGMTAAFEPPSLYDEVPQDLPLGMRWMGHRDHIRVTTTNFDNFRLIDATPAPLSYDEYCLNQHRLFRPIEHNAIVVPDESVSELLARIHEKQDAERQEWLKRQLRENKTVERNTHAQIITLAA